MICINAYWIGQTEIGAPGKLKYWRAGGRDPQPTHIEGRVSYFDGAIVHWLKGQGATVRGES